jgi:predicted CopG family antitoxin
MTVKNPKYKTIEVSTETYMRLLRVKKELEKIFHNNISFDKMLKLLLSPKLVDYSEIFAEKTPEKPKVEGETQE